MFLIELIEQIDQKLLKHFKIKLEGIKGITCH